MKKRFHGVFICVILIIFAGTLSASASSRIDSGVDLEWTSQLFKDSEDGISSLSTAFVGPFQVPMLSYNRAGQHHIYMAFKATSAVSGNCGPNSSWFCTSWQDSSLIPGSVSNMSTVNYIDTHAIRWVYSTGDTLRGVYLELMNDMTIVASDWITLVDLSKFGSLVGTPSVQIDTGGHYHVAFVALQGGDLFPHSLVYIHYVGGTNTTCTNSGSPYQCDVIDTSLSNGSMASPSLQISRDGNVGLAYYKSGVVMYAYPHETQPGWPSNCGTGDDPWRCIPIFSGTPTGTVGNVVKLALGDSLNYRTIAFTYADELQPVTLKFANYVGSGGNCGLDSRFGGFTDYRFQCDDLIYHYHLAPGAVPSFSIKIDQYGYQLIAFDYRQDELGNNDLFIAYPRSRVGDPTPGWTTQKIDGAPVFDIETGAQASLAINRNNRMGFIGYLQEEPYELDDLKIAFQLYRSLLPVVSKP